MQQEISGLVFSVRVCCKDMAIAGLEKAKARLGQRVLLPVLAAVSGNIDNVHWPHPHTCHDSQALPVQVGAGEGRFEDKELGALHAVEAETCQVRL